MPPRLFMENKMKDRPQTMAMQQLQGSGDAKDDIVSVLRNRKEFCQYPGEWKWMRSTVPDHDCQRAADRIEALEAALHTAFMAMCAQRDTPDDEVFQDAIDALGLAALAPEQDK
jgi:hypothetical protein